MPLPEIELEVPRHDVQREDVVGILLPAADGVSLHDPGPLLQGQRQEVGVLVPGPVDARPALVPLPLPGPEPRLPRQLDAGYVQDPVRLVVVERAQADAEPVPELGADRLEAPSLPYQGRHHRIQPLELVGGEVYALAARGEPGIVRRLRLLCAVPAPWIAARLPLPAPFGADVGPSLRHGAHQQLEVRACIYAAPRPAVPAAHCPAAASCACSAHPRALLPARAAHRQVRSRRPLLLLQGPVRLHLPRHGGGAHACLPGYLPCGIASPYAFLDDHPAILVHVLPLAVSHRCLPSGGSQQQQKGC